MTSASAALLGSGQGLPIRTLNQANAVPDLRSPHDRQRRRRVTGKPSRHLLTRAALAVPGGDVVPLTAFKGFLQPVAELAKEDNPKGGPVAGKLKEGAAKAKASLPGPQQASQAGKAAQQQQPQQAADSFDLEALKQKGAEGLKSAGRGLEDAVLPPKPPEPPQIAEPTSSITSGANSQVAAASPTEVRSPPSGAGKPQGGPASASRPAPHLDLSTTTQPQADLADAAQPSLAEGTGQAADSAQSSLAGSASPAADAAGQAQDSLASSSGQAADAASQASSSAADAAAQAQSSLATASDAAPSAKAGLADAYEAASRGSRGLTGRFSSDPGQAVSSLQDSAQSAFSEATHSLQDALSGIARSAQEALSSASDSLSQASSSVNASSGGAVQQAQDAAQGAADASRLALSGAAAQANEAAGSFLDALPPEVRQAALSAKGPIQQLFSQIAADGNLRNAAGVAVAVPLLLIWRARRGGFSGYLTPDAALELLNKRNAVLIDLRPDEARASDGVPELRFGARGKGAAISIPALKRSLTSRSRSGGDLPYAVAAVEIQGLRQVDRRSQIVIIEARNKTGLKLARALQKQGQARSYILQGGFLAWQSAGLPIKSIPEYGSTAFDAITDEAELLATRTKQTVTYLSDPINLVITLIAAAGSVNTVRDWHNTLQVIGVYGPLLSTTLWYSGFPSSQAAADDAMQRVNRFLSFFAGLVPKAPAPQPAAAGSSGSKQLTIPFQEALPETRAKAPTSVPSPAAQKPASQPDTQQQQQQQRPQASKPDAQQQQSEAAAPEAMKPVPAKPAAAAANDKPAAADPAAVQAASKQAFPPKQPAAAQAEPGSTQSQQSAAQQQQRQPAARPAAAEQQAEAGAQQKSLGQTKGAELAVKADTPMGKQGKESASAAAKKASVPNSASEAGSAQQKESS